MNDEAIRKIVTMGNARDKNALVALNTLLFDRWCYKIFYLLGLLLKFPNDFDNLIMENIDDTLRHYMLIAYKRDSTETLNIPNGMFGIRDETLWRMADIYAPDVFETHFNIYLNKFINEIRESPDTKKAFFDELKRTYYKDIKEILLVWKNIMSNWKLENLVTKQNKNTPFSVVDRAQIAQVCADKVLDADLL